MRKIVSFILLIALLFNSFNLQIEASGDILLKMSENYKNYSELSAWEALGLSLYGYDISETYIKDMENDLKEKEGVYRSALDYAKLIMVLKEAGKNPSNFVGYDLLTSLANFKDIDRTGINGIIFSIFALHGQSLKKDVIWDLDKLASKLLEYQNPDGGFPLVKGWASDVDLTALAVSALAYCGSSKKVEDGKNAALNNLSKLMDDDGLVYFQGSDSSENLSQMIIALVMSGISLDDVRFVRKNKSLYDTLIEVYMTKDYKFKHNKDGPANNMASEQAYLALLALEKGYVYSKKEKISPSPSPSPSPSSQPTGIPSPSSQPTSTTEPPVVIESPFSDYEDIWDIYYEDMLFALEEKIIVLDDLARLRPNDVLTKEELADLIHKSAPFDLNIYIPRFYDVGPEDLYGKSIITAYLNGLISFDNSGNFYPKERVNSKDFSYTLKKTFGNSLNFSLEEMLGKEGFVTRQEAISIFVKAYKQGDN